MTSTAFTKRPNKRTKIVATIGPASNSDEMLRQMVLAGLDVVRINFSHSNPEAALPIVERIKRIRDELDVPVAILGDLRGPRIRVGEIEGGSVELQAGQTLRMVPTPLVGNADVVSVSYDKLAQDVQIDRIVLLDDGNITLRVTDIKDDGEVVCEVLQGNKLSSKRGLNLPGSDVSLPSVTEKDFQDADFAIEQDFDFLALSFVQTADDVRMLSDYLKDKGSNIGIISKIERRNAAQNIESIVQESYGIMVARGDLALEMSIEEVPIAQKKIIGVARKYAKPVITATQMVESMIEMAKPTRAEATDVANAVLDGTDALMLSGESAIGKYPAQAIATMSAIAMHTENAWMHEELQGPPAVEPFHELEPAVAHAGCAMAKTLNADMIVTFTTSGFSAQRVASHRPSTPILALSAYTQTRRRLSLTWGVQCRLSEIVRTTDSMTSVAVQEAIKAGLELGDLIVFIAGTPPYGRSGRTNTVKVQRIRRRHLEGKP